MNNVKERGLYKRGNIWYINYYANYARKREAVGTNKQLAREILAKRRVEVKEDINFNIKKDKVTVFDEIVKDFLEYSKNNKKSYSRDLQITNHLLDFFAGKMLNEFTPYSIEQYKTTRLNNDQMMPATVNRELTCFKTIFNWAIKGKKASVNPVKGIKFLKVDNTRTRYLTEDEIKRLVENCPPYFKPIIITALTTGMRKSEILNLKWKNVDLTNGIIFLTDTKNGRMREIPICTLLYDKIQECKKLAVGEYVFCSSKGKPYSKDIRTMFLRILDKARISDFRFHDLRHTAASYLVMQGVDLLTVKEILGHQRIEMTLRYAHLSPLHKKSAIELLGMKIAEATATTTATVGKLNNFKEHRIMTKMLNNREYL